MATRTDELLGRYLHALERHDDRSEREAERLARGHDVRTCANCGEHTVFRIDPGGVWSECTNCGRLA